MVAACGAAAENQGYELRFGSPLCHFMPKYEMNHNNLRREEKSVCHLHISQPLGSFESLHTLHIPISLTSLFMKNWPNGGALISVIVIRAKIME